MAYAHDWTTDSGNYNVGARILDQEINLCRYIDTTETGYDLGSGEYIKLFAVPANFLLTDAMVIVETGEGASETIDIVDDDSATTTFVNNVNLNTAGTIGATAARKLYTSAGFICVHADAAITAAKFYVFIRGLIVNTSM